MKLLTSFNTEGVVNYMVDISVTYKGLTNRLNLLPLLNVAAEISEWKFKV